MLIILSVMHSNLKIGSSLRNTKGCNDLIWAFTHSSSSSILSYGCFPPLPSRFLPPYPLFESRPLVEPSVFSWSWAAVVSSLHLGVWASTGNLPTDLGKLWSPFVCCTITAFQRWATRVRRIWTKKPHFGRSELHWHRVVLSETG